MNMPNLNTEDNAEDDLLDSAAPEFLQKTNSIKTVDLEHVSNSKN